MRTIRIYLKELENNQDTIVLNKEQSNYLRNTLRLKPGHLLKAFDGHNQVADLQIEKFDGKLVIIKISNRKIEDNESPLKIHLLQALVSHQKLELIIQKATELGVHEITPIFTEYSEIKYNKDKIDKKLEHWRNVCIAACQQSERNYLPRINRPQSIDSACENISSPYNIYLHPESTHSLDSTIKPDSITVAIGPEGGFSDKDIAALIKHKFTAAFLGPRILRTETAGMTVCSILQYQYGDFTN